MAKEDFQPNLTAIISADLASYIRLTGEDEEARVGT